MRIPTSPTLLAVTLMVAIAGIGPVGEIVQAQTGFKFTEGPAANTQGNVLVCSEVPRRESKPA